MSLLRSTGMQLATTMRDVHPSTAPSSQGAKSQVSASIVHHVMDSVGFLLLFAWGFTHLHSHTNSRKILREKKQTDVNWFNGFSRKENLREANVLSVRFIGNCVRKMFCIFLN